MNSLNLRQIDGGNVIKQADFGSNLSFELLDERRRKIPGLDGQTATIRLIKGDNIAYQTESQVVDGSVSFKFDRVLEKGIYVLEIVAGNYVFPSNNMLKITIEKTAGNYKPENVVKTDLVELQGKITAIEQREHDVNQELLDVGQKQAEMTKRIETLESREDHDTIYNDTEIKKSIANVDNKVSGLSEKVTALEERPIVDTALTKRVEALERKEDKDTVYDDSAIVKRIESLEAREDKDTVYDDSDLKHRVTELENRPVAEPYNDIEIKDRLTVLESKQDKDTIYDDTDIKERISALEEKPDNDTIYDDTNLKSQVSELQEKLKSLNTVRRAPTGYTLDRTTVPWTIWFDNGCGLQLVNQSPKNEREKQSLVYSYGFNAPTTSMTPYAGPIPELIISATRGTFTVDKFKESDEGHFQNYINIVIINPIKNDIEKYDWTNAFGDRVNTNWNSTLKVNFTKLMYQLGIWSDNDVKYLGATLK